MRHLAARRTAIAALVVSAGCGLLAASDAGTGIALLAMASVAGLFAVPPAARRWLGATVIVIGAGASVLGDLGGDVLAWCSAAALSVAGALIVVGGPSWPALSGRYGPAGGGADGQSPADGPKDFWQALDRGHDPTVTEPHDTSDDTNPPGGPDVH